MYARSWNVAGSIPEEVIAFFNWPNPSRRTRSLGSTQPLTKMSTGSPAGGKERLSHKTWQPHCHLWANCLENVEASTAFYRDSFTFYFYILCFLKGWHKGVDGNFIRATMLLHVVLTHIKESVVAWATHCKNVMALYNRTWKIFLWSFLKCIYITDWWCTIPPILFKINFVLMTHQLTGQSHRSLHFHILCLLTMLLTLPLKVIPGTHYAGHRSTKVLYLVGKKFPLIPF
jgi:hypothetical protein